MIEPLSSNDLGYTYEHTGLCEKFLKFAVEIGSDAMTYMPNFIKIDSSIKTLLIEKHKHTDNMKIRSAYFHFLGQGK